MGITEIVVLVWGGLNLIAGAIAVPLRVASWFDRAEYIGWGNREKKLD